MSNHKFLNKLEQIIGKKLDENSSAQIISLVCESKVFIKFNDCNYGLYDEVKPIDECKLEKHLRFLVIGEPIVDNYGLFWTPVKQLNELDQLKDEDDQLTYFKTSSLEKIENSEASKRYMILKTL